ncbi:TatD family hydrolase [Roseivirga sp. BDSF3-8]|uniref:TatD family hydrolase n=1 Tax=Roseivirga sp. BDSF3-8 TaxID=3241598 RepID=UPI0035320215
MKLIDTHAHVYSEKFNQDRDQMLQRAKEAGVEKIFMPNIDAASVTSMLEVEELNPGYCIPMMGLHPCSVQKDFERELYQVEEWLDKRKFAAVGEIGIDLYWDKSTQNIQEIALGVQIDQAKKHNLPIVLHTRESFHQTLQVIKKHHWEGLTGIFHCFSGSLQEAEEAIEMGFLLGIGGVSTFKNGGLDKVLPHINPKHLVLETDCPYLAPVPHRGKRNEVSYVELVVRRVADLTEMNPEKLAEITTQNALKFFKEIS